MSHEVICSECGVEIPNVMQCHFCNGPAVIRRMQERAEKAEARVRGLEGGLAVSAEGCDLAEAYERGLADGEQQAFLDAKHPAWESGYNACKKDNASREREAYERGIADGVAHAAKPDDDVPDDDPSTDGTDAAHPAWKRGYERGRAETLQAVGSVGFHQDHPDLDGTDAAHPAYKRGFDAGVAGIPELRARAEKAEFEADAAEARVRELESLLRVTENQNGAYRGAIHELGDRAERAEKQVEELREAFDDDKLVWRAELAEARLAAVLPMLEKAEMTGGEVFDLAKSARARLAELDGEKSGAFPPAPEVRPELAEALGAAKAGFPPRGLWKPELADPLDRPVTYRALIEGFRSVTPAHWVIGQDLIEHFAKGGE